MVSGLHDLGRQQLWGRHAQWCGIAASIPLAWRLMPHAVGMQQRPPILGSLIAGEVWEMRVGDMKDALKKQISPLLRPFTNPEGAHEPPHRCKGDPDPCIAIGLIIEPSQRRMVWRGLHNAPAFVQRAFDDLKVSPAVTHHPSTVLSRAIQPCTHGLFVDLDEACRRSDRMAFRSCPHRHFNNRWVGVQVQVGGPISE
jgi:hypothetical protein